jgi:hypothetical protein
MTAISPEEFKAWVADYEAHEPFSYVVDVDPEEAERIAQWRHKASSGGIGDIKFGGDPIEAGFTGALGELGFSAWSGLPMPPLRIDGDGGVDFRVLFARREITIDIKTSARARPDLLLPLSRLTKGSAEWLVLARKLNKCQVQLLGWEHKSVIALMPVHDWGNRDRPVYVRPAYQLRPMNQLGYLLGLRQS